MNPCHEETSGSTSSSSLSSGPPLARACPSSLPGPEKPGGDAEEWTSKHVRMASTFPSELHGGDGGGLTHQKGPSARRRSTIERLCWEDCMSLLTSTGSGGVRVKSAAINEKNASPRKMGPIQEAKHRSNGGGAHRESSREKLKVDVPSKTAMRQRPLSAPSKAYPSARFSGSSGDAVGVGSGARTGAVGVCGSNRRDRDCGASKGERETRINGSGTRAGGGGERGSQRESLSSVAMAASERRPSEESKNFPSGMEQGGGRGGGGRFVGGKAPAKMPPSSQDFGLHQWKEYAVMRHGKNPRFSNSDHGRGIILETASVIRAQELGGLNRELKETRDWAKDLQKALRSEQEEKSKLKSRVVHLEREMEGMETARRRLLKKDASNRERGSNLERRLAGNTGTLRTFLFGADAKAETPRVCALGASSMRSTARRSSTSKSPIFSGHSRSAKTGTTSVVSSRGDELEGDRMEEEDDVVHRVRETAELEQSELRRRHDVEMSAKQARLEKIKKENRKLEAERDGLRQAAETQAAILSGGYAELKASVEELVKRQHRPLASADSCQSKPSTCDAGQVESGKGAGENTASTEATSALTGTMLATEEGLNHQVRTLQILLMEAVAAAVPTVIMPPAVTGAVDSIREGMDLPPQTWPRRPRGPSIAGSTSVPGGFVLVGTGDSKRGGNDFECTGYDASASGMYCPSWAVLPQRAHHRARLPDANGRRTMDDIASERSKTASTFVGQEDGRRTDREPEQVDVPWAGITDGKRLGTKAYGLSFHGITRGDSVGSGPGSEGSGTRFPQVMPVDDDSEDGEQEAEVRQQAPCFTGERAGQQLRTRKEDSLIAPQQHWWTKGASSSTPALPEDATGNRKPPAPEDNHIPAKSSEGLLDAPKRPRASRERKNNGYIAEVATNAYKAMAAGGQSGTLASRPALLDGRGESAESEISSLGWALGYSESRRGVITERTLLGDERTLIGSEKTGLSL